MRLTLLGAGVALLLGLWVLSSLVVPHRDLCVEAIHKRGYPVTPAELDAWYLSVPQAENAALVYTNAFGLMTNATGPITNFNSTSWLPPIGEGLSSKEQSDLRAVLAECQPALRLLYSAPASGRSRYPVQFQTWPSMLLPHLRFQAVSESGGEVVCPCRELQ